MCELQKEMQAKRKLQFEVINRLLFALPPLTAQNREIFSHFQSNVKCRFSSHLQCQKLLQIDFSIQTHIQIHVKIPQQNAFTQLIWEDNMSVITRETDLLHVG